MYLNASSLSGIFLLKSETIGLPRFHLNMISVILDNSGLLRSHEGFRICRSKGSNTAVA